MERGGEKMAEKSMSSLPLIKTLKSQIAAQKPLTKKKNAQTTKKDTLHQKTKNKPQKDGRGNNCDKNKFYIHLTGDPQNEQ